MSERPRALPSWMSKKKEEKEKEPLKRRGKRKTARPAFYCMNEKELVEAAVSYLTNGACEDVVLLTHQKAKDKAVDTTVKLRESPASPRTIAKPVISEEFSDCSDAQGTTYVSETDLDITEVETVPYTKSPQHQCPEGQRSGPLQDHSSLMNVEMGANKKEERSKMPADAAEEDDALRLVREIFFS